MKAYIKSQLKYVTRPFGLFCFSAASLVAANSVPLYLEPDANSTVYFKADAAHLKKLPSTAYPRGEAHAQWRKVDYEGEYVGYVKSIQVEADNTVKPGTYIFLDPNGSSPVIAQSANGSDTIAMGRGDEWSPVAHTGKGYAYYQSSAMEEPVSYAQAEEQGGQPQPEPIMSVSVEQTGSNEPLEVVTHEHVGADEHTQPPPVEVEPVAPAPVPIPVEYRAEEMAKLSDSKLMRRYVGRFVRLSGFDKIFADHDYAYVLENSDGETIAYLDINDVLIFLPIEDYFGKQVVIDGTVENVNEEPPMVLKARFIQLQ